MWFGGKSAAVVQAQTDARLSALEQRVARTELELRELVIDVSRMKGILDADEHFQQVKERLSALERSSDDKAGSLGKLEGRLEGVLRMIDGIREALAHSSDQGVSSVAKQITVNTFVADSQQNQAGNDNSQQQRSDNK